MYVIFMSGSRKFKMTKLGDTRNLAPIGMQEFNIFSNEDSTSLCAS